MIDIICSLIFFLVIWLGLEMIGATLGRMFE